MDKWKRGNGGMTQSEMVIIIRPSFKKVCGPDACRAGLYNHILYRLAKKAKNEPEKDVRKGNIFWFASAEDICQDIDEAWCVNKVRKEIKQLVDAGLLGQRHNPIKKWDRKYQYFLSEEQGEKLLEKCEAEGVCLLHIGLNAEVLHLLHMVNAFNKNGGCICQKEEMELPNMGNASTINGGAIPEGSQPKGSTEGSLSEGEEESNSDDTPKPPVVSSDTARATTFEAYSFIVPTNYVEALAYLAPHGGVPSGYTAAQVLKLAQKLYAEAQDEKMFTNEKPQGDDHAHRVPTVPAANTPVHNQHPVSRHPESDSSDTPGPGDVRALGNTLGSTTSSGQEAGSATNRVTETPPTPMPAQSLSPFPQTEQAALGTVQQVDPNRGVTAFQEPEKPNQTEDQKAGKWNAQAMVARACELRGKPFSDTARPKETKAAHKLFARKPDLTEEELERAFQQWNTQWWRETNGLFNLTDLAAVPKNKSEMRLIIALEKLALSKTITRQSGQIIPISGTKRYSSYDDPNFRSDQDFYPVEGGSYAAASV